MRPSISCPTTRAAMRELSAAVEFRGTSVALDPLNEPAHRQLMVACSRAGDRPRALAQYGELTRSLADDSPSSRYRRRMRLYESVRHGTPRPVRQQ